MSIFKGFWNRSDRIRMIAHSLTSFVFLCSHSLKGTDLASVNKLYESGQYGASITGYEELLTLGETGTVHFNLGNSYFRMNQTGRAIFHFLKANERLPRDADVNFNLNLVREKVRDKIENKTNVYDYIFSTLKLNQRESAFILLFFSFLFSLTGIFTIYKKFSWLSGLKKMFLALSVLSLFITLGKMNKPWWGVVGIDEAKVFSSTGRDGVLLFSIHEGAELTVEEQDGEWLKIKLSDGKKGWVRQENILF